MVHVMRCLNVHCECVTIDECDLPCAPFKTLNCSHQTFCWMRMAISDCQILGWPVSLETGNPHLVCELTAEDFIRTK